MKHLALTPVATAVIAILTMPVAIAEEKKESLGTITVNDTAENIKDRDRQGYDTQYEKDGGSVYLGKDLVERYKGTSTADVLNSAIGVYSGDARNSGALDPNVRGIQGQERVPVTVDGTEQALTVWRGYNGANNRNYIDPSLISSIDVEKSASLTGDVKTSVGGGIAIRTIGIDDVVSPGDEFGMSLRVETSSNSKTPRIPNYGYGEDYRDHPELYKDRNNYVFSDPAVNINPASKGNAGFFNLKDNSGRLAVGTRQERFDLMAAYAHRRQGNYFSGKNGANRYREPVRLNDKQTSGESVGPDPYLPFAANVFAPGKEVANTSMEMESWLVKSNLFLTDSQTLHLGFRRSTNTYGEIMPSRLAYSKLAETGTQPQWPLANFSVNAWNLGYAWKPEDNRWIDLDATLWTTHAVGNTNTSGGYPREPRARDYLFEYGLRPRNPDIDGSLINTAATNSRNDRTGFTLRNKMALTSNLDLTLAGDMMKEKLDSNDAYITYTASPFIAAPRKGHRQESSVAFNFDYRPTSWLELNAGAKYINGWVEDDFLKENLKNRQRFSRTDDVVYKNIFSSRMLTSDEYQRALSLGWSPDDYSTSPILAKSLGMTDEYGSVPEVFNPGFGTDGIYRIGQYREWHPDSNGRYTKDTNPFFNGSIDPELVATDPVSGISGRASRAGGRVDDVWQELPESEHWKQPGKQKNSGWAPAFGATAWITDDDRVYARYTETLRLPTIFENTSGAGGRDPRRYTPNMKWQPERGKTVEVGYVRNLQKLLNAERHADVKINYYNTVIENVFDRNGRLEFAQMDKHKTSGIEAQARYDNGGFFMDIGIDYRLKNQVCDSQAAAQLDPGNVYHLKECVTAGFPGGFLRTQLQPKYAINSNLGLRFMEETLEVGTRLRYTSSARNNDEPDLMTKFPNRYSMANNSPMHWTPTFTADLYTSYQLSRSTNVEFLVTNLTDRYYIDPLTRSMMPAPGRTLRLSISSQF